MNNTTITGPGELFTKQLDGCTYCSGGLNCTCACHSMWTYRATQGRIRRTACQMRSRTGDKVGGTNLEQMLTLASADGIKGAALWRPGKVDDLIDLLRTGRYGAHWQGGYSALAGTAWDCFEGNFRGNHDLYLSSGASSSGREGDPGADERRGDIPAGYQQAPWTLLRTFAGRLDLGNGATLNSRFGAGHVYALLTPADPIVTSTRWLVTIAGDLEHRTRLWYAPNGTKDGAVSRATYICTRSLVQGEWWYRIIGTASGKPTTNRGRYFQPNRTVTARRA